MIIQVECIGAVMHDMHHACDDVTMPIRRCAVCMYKNSHGTTSTAARTCELKREHNNNSAMMYSDKKSSSKLTAERQPTVDLRFSRRVGSGICHHVRGIVTHELVEA